MVAQALRNLKASGHEFSVEVGVADARALPFADGTFDRVVSTGSLHHWKHPLDALSEIHRVLKANCHALLYDLVREMPEAVRASVRSQFGGFRLALLGLHSFEEPFLSVEEMEGLGRQTEFLVEGNRFVGALCCLVLRKVPKAASSSILY